MAARKSDGNTTALLAGVAFVVLTVLGFVVAGEPPAADASPGEVVDYFTDKDGLVMFGAVLEALAAVAVLFFAGAVSRVARRDDDGVLPTIIAAGGVVLATGLGVDASLRFALADIAGDLDPTSVQTINAVWSDFFFPLAIGMATLVLAIGLTARRTRIVPTWMAWIGVLLAVVFFTPAGFVAFLISGVWTIVASILIWRRESTGAVVAAAR